LREGDWSRGVKEGEMGKHACRRDWGEGGYERGIDYIGRAK
jgi:hypothetical protein